MPFHHLHLTLPPLNPTPCFGNHNLFSVSMSSCFVLFCFQMPGISEIILYLSFSVWLVSLSIMSSGSIPIVANGRIPSFLWLNNSTVNHIFLVHSSAGTLRLFPYLGYCESCRNGSIHISSWSYFHFWNVPSDSSSIWSMDLMSYSNTSVSRGRKRKAEYNPGRPGVLKNCVSVWKAREGDIASLKTRHHFKSNTRLLVSSCLVTTYQ